jgi:hypothetical protein
MSTIQPPWLPGHRFIDKIDTAGFAEAPDAQPGDIYNWSRLSGNTGTAQEGNVNERFATLTRVNPKQRACVKILAQRGGLLSAALVTCWPDDK